MARVGKYNYYRVIETICSKNKLVKVTTIMSATTSALYVVTFTPV